MGKHVQGKTFQGGVEDMDMTKLPRSSPSACAIRKAPKKLVLWIFSGKAEMPWLILSWFSLEELTSCCASSGITI
uniref:Peroxisomal testis enriched protein 1 n=1 Tax=Molossus molossus TaxID=27622 RepID=A0A7J8GTB7_MOLMO|nr:peroxisomal testis enriched protein 1 [Molossus molossus]